jgi:hypothetical protein
MSKKRTPYQGQPPSSFWRNAVTDLPVRDVDPVVNFGLKISRNTKIVTAGSCFAQHIARHLKSRKFNYLVTEPGHPMLPERLLTKYNYGVFSARYGNIYTPRQLLQLFNRAYGAFCTRDNFWSLEDGSLVDPFRPSVHPGGFSTERELDLDREQHLAAVRDCFESCDVFIFTLGLTECWMARVDGAVYPICPGVNGGIYDPSLHMFKNLTVTEVVNDLMLFLEELGKVNPSCQVVLTVSPVPLVATAQNEHVLAATTYSKAVLRAAAGEVCNLRKHVHYFPSYEIVTGSFTRGAYFAENLRDVTEEGVEHVMTLFFKHVADEAVHSETLTTINQRKSDGQKEFLNQMETIVKVMCDEEQIGR